MPDIDKVFAGSIPKLYEVHLVPLIFEPYAADLKKRVGLMNMSRILEVAAGTGVVTRALATVANEAISIVATDLNQAMLDEAAAVGTARPVQWQQADAMALPFPDAQFDAVICQFGVMFHSRSACEASDCRAILNVFREFRANALRRASVSVAYRCSTCRALAEHVAIRNVLAPRVGPGRKLRGIDVRSVAVARSVRGAATTPAYSIPQAVRRGSVCIGRTVALRVYRRRRSRVTSSCSGRRKRRRAS